MFQEDSIHLSDTGNEELDVVDLEEPDISLDLCQRNRADPEPDLTASRELPKGIPDITMLDPDNRLLAECADNPAGLTLLMREALGVPPVSEMPA